MIAFDFYFFKVYIFPTPRYRDNGKGYDEGMAKHDFKLHTASQTLKINGRSNATSAAINRSAREVITENRDFLASKGINDASNLFRTQ